MTRIGFVALAALAGSALAQEPAFFAAWEDVPLPPGFSETDATAGFAGPVGRLTVAQAVGQAAPEAVVAFYAQTLPHLGWAETPAGGTDLREFRRGRERLSLRAQAADQGDTRVYIVVITEPASMAVDAIEGEPSR